VLHAFSESAGGGGNMALTLTDLTAEITTACPNRCLFCSSDVWHKPTAGCLSVDLLLSIARQARELGLQRMSLSGGEPLLHPDLATIVQAIRDAGLQPVIYTTGIRSTLEPETWDAFTPANPILIFNVQSTEAEIHDELAGRAGALDSTLTSVHSAIARGVRTEVHIVPTRVNLATMASTIDRLAAMGVHRVSLLRLVPQGSARRNRDRLEMQPGDLAQLRQSLCTIRNTRYPRTSIRLGIPFSMMVGAPQACNAGDSKLLVRPDGCAFPCEAFKICGRGEYSLGNVNDTLLAELLRRSHSLSDLVQLKTSAVDDSCPAQFLYR
jgi:radical SAM protein with 4Fe4S-binding SPASM domain